MKWVDILEPDTTETVSVYGYECSACGYVASRKWLKCPRCGEKLDSDAVRAVPCIICGEPIEG